MCRWKPDLPARYCWKVRLGLRNEYNSEPSGDREALETTYYTSIVGDWH